MAGNWQRGVMRLMGISNHPVKVEEIVDVTVWYRRIRFSAPSFVGDLEVFPTLWVRFWLPNPARGPEALAQRAYTVVAVDREAGTFTVEFVLHEASGPAGDWAQAARVGDELEIALTPARVKLPPRIGSVLLAGDVTALPAVNSWLPALPESTPVRVFLEDGHADHDLLPVAARENLTWTWVTPGATPGAELARAVAALEPQDGLFAWAAGERGLVKALRPVLKNQLNLDRAHQFSQFYWMADKAFG
ncbi:siderophore-interacting protein [Kineosporia sp. J2-2]|uniref:Siderophore-interacting protein n=1 Tax=Kineosporia corallincola TaxID=2835133 RepID=A0ABS5TFD0_9ACTN|nr:siderophore-interacting protein [Kineosporia corallincola]MBT0769124.1 siderophore-interacting protein [Kineosporia corallincola]